MPEPLDDVCCASLPAGALSLLADLRARPGVRVQLDGGRMWVYWTAGDAAVVRRVLPVRGAAIFARHGGAWRQLGHSLPAFGIPDETGARPLVQVLFPSPVQPQFEGRPSFERMQLVVVRDGRPRPATALLCPLEAMVQWADGAPARRLASLRAVLCDNLLLVRGERLPELPHAERFWGGSVLAPLGFRPEPGLAERELAQAIGLEEGDAALLTAEGVEVIDGRLFQPLTRAGLRLARGGRP